MPAYLFLFGNTPRLSKLELSSLLSKQTKSIQPNSDLSLGEQQWSPHLMKVELESDEQAQQLMSLLGGTFKVIKLIQELNPEQPYSQIASYLTTKTDKPTFSLTGFGSAQSEFNSKQLKHELKQNGVSSRYRRSDQWGLSAAILTHEADVFDLFVVEHQQQRFLGQTTAVQAVDDWTERDRHKPYVAAKKGMLPPKLARIMVNIGLGLGSDKIVFSNDQSPSQQPVLYDPFCGTGTVLIEALLRGCQVVGSDLDHDSVAGTLENLYWLEDKYQQSFQYQVFQSDAAHVDQRQWQTQVDLIVTEPFLGKPSPKNSEFDNIFTGLTSLYLGAFKTWTKLLNSGARVVIVFPFAVDGKKRYDLNHLIDKLGSYGYTLEVKPIEFYREKAVIRREIHVFRYQKK